MSVKLTDGRLAVVSQMLYRSELGNSPIFECMVDGCCLLIPIYDMSTELGEAYREDIKKRLCSHKRLLRDIGLSTITEECIREIKPNLTYVVNDDVHYVVDNGNVVGVGEDQQSAWLSVFDNIL